MNFLIISFVLISLTKTQNDFDRYIGSKIISNKWFDDTSVVKKKLPIYDTSPCIENLLKHIVIANRRFYDVTKNFYSLSLKKEREKEYLVIELSEYYSTRTFDYVGAIKVYGAIFLCRGDITIDTLFKMNNKFLSVCLTKAKGSENFNYGIEPSLRGLYRECSENISIEVYTPAALPGYRMEERKSKK